MTVEIIKFWATWCIPCKKYKPVLDSVVESRDDVTLTEVDVDADKETAAKYGVQGVPYTVFKKDGKILGGFNGLRTPREIHRLIDSFEDS